MSVDWVGLASEPAVWGYAAVVAGCTWGLWWLSRWSAQPWCDCGRRMSSLRAWWRARRLMRRVDVDTWAWEWYVEDWYARYGSDDLAGDVSQEIPRDGGEGGNW